MNEISQLEKIRHTLAHLLAAAVLQIYPDTKNTIGPAIDNGFYYDFEFSTPLTEKDLGRIDQKMRELLKTPIPLISWAIAIENQSMKASKFPVLNV